MELKTQNTLSISAGLTIVILSNVNGHFNPPFSILWTPIFLPIIIAAINLPLYRTNFQTTIFYNFSLLLLNDLLIRFFAGGIHDHEGKAWIFLFFALAFTLGFILMILYALATNEREAGKIQKKKIGGNVGIVVISAIGTGIIYALVNINM